MRFRYDVGRQVADAEVTAQPAEPPAIARPPRAAPWRQAVRLAWPASLTRVDGLALAAVALLALTLRLYDLDGLPTGLHGDEAAAGLDARRILDEGWIGPYTGMAAGQPTGPLYLFAVSVGLFGSDVISLRIVPAVLGSLTVALLYITTARSYGRMSGLFAAALLAGMQWHVHYSRVGFPIAAWPLLSVGLMAALSAAVQSTRPSTWLLAGALCGGGVYVYNAHVGLVLVCLVFVVMWLAATYDRQQALARLGRLALFLLAMLAVALPMIDYATHHSDIYFGHFERDSLTNTPQWAARETLLDKADLIRERYVDYWRKLLTRPGLDGLDGMGTSPVLSRGLFIVGLVGVPFALWRRPTPAWLALLIVLLMPFGSVMTVDAFARRTFVLAPCIALFGGVALAEMVRFARRGSLTVAVSWRGQNWRPGVSGSVAFAGASLVCASIISAESTAYFSTFRAHSLNRWTYGLEFLEAVQFMRDEPSGTFYFYSNRWTAYHEVRVFLAPDVRVEDHSREFGEFTTDLPDGQAVTFVLLGPYRELLADLQRRYPGGATTIEGPPDDPWFIAYRPPR